MFRQIVIGVDERVGSRDAIALASRLLAKDGELSLAHVYAGDPHIYRGVSAPFAAGERERAIDLLERIRAQTGIRAHLRWQTSPSVGRGLHELCELIGADLLVVGSSRRGLLGRVLIGDDTRAALNGAPCAIAIAPTGYADEPTLMREIGVGYDGSPESEHALALARRLVAEIDGRLSASHAVESKHAHELARELGPDLGAKLSAFQAGALPTSAFAPGRLPLSQAIETLVDAARDEIAALGGVEPHAAYGDPAEELTLYSASLDLLIVGSRGYGPIGRLIHGSTSRELARTARCPLLVLPRSTLPIDTLEPADDGQETAAPVNA
jgi:nucleotide-binding universal stress UspA family protein